MCEDVRGTCVGCEGCMCGCVTLCIMYLLVDRPTINYCRVFDKEEREEHRDPTNQNCNQ